MAPLPWKSFWSFYCFILALLIVGQLCLGLYMTGLELYHPWYHKAPRLHKGTGLLIASLALVRIGVRLSNGVPTLRQFFVSLRYNVYGVQHILLYAVILTTASAGFGFATSDGKPAPFFGLFDIPSPATLSKETGNILDALHHLLAWTLIVLILLHSIEKMLLLLQRLKK